MKYRFGKKVGMLVLACVMAISMAVPAAAATAVEPDFPIESNDGSYLDFEPVVTRSTPINFNFTVKVNAGSVSSSSAFKDDEDGYATANSLSSTTVSSTNKISFRVRADATNNPMCTDLYTRQDTTGFDMWYTFGGFEASYKLWASAPSANKAAVSMSGKFYP